MTKRFPTHPGEESLEEYLLQRLPEEHASQVEEHLLICEPCQETVHELEEFLAAIKAAAAEPASEGWRFSWARGVGAASAAALLAGVIVLRTGGPVNEVPAAVRLSSTRGVTSQAEAPAGKPLQLSINAPDLTAGQTYQISVVDAAGSTVWAGKAAYAEGNLAAQMPKALRRGVYWVRLYDGEQRQLREFGLLAK